MSLAGSTAFAGNELTGGDHVRMMNEYVGEMTECSAYLQVASWCVGDANPDVAKNLETNSRTMGGQAIILGEKLGIKGEAFAARFKLDVQDMQKMMDKNCLNISILMERYMKFCEGMQKTPLKRLEELEAGNDCNSTYKCN
jgi:hypothetical protein